MRQDWRTRDITTYAGEGSDLIDVENVVSVVDPEDRVGGVPVKTVHSEDKEINSLRCVSVPKGVQRN